MSNALEGVIFDFDGPIFDARGACRAALLATFDQYEASLGRPSAAIDALPLFGPEALIALTYAELPGAAAMLPEICAFYRLELADRERQTKVTEAVRSLIRDLREKEIKVAILSSRPTSEVVDLLARLGMRDWFNEVWGRDVPAGCKPSPEPVKALAATLRSAPSELVYVGDSDRDFDAAKGAGVTYYHAAWTGEPTARAHTGCNTLLRSVEDMATVLREAPPQVLRSHKSMPPTLTDGIRANRLAYYAGAGVSVPSGVGDWNGHYLPLLRTLQAGPWADRFRDNMPQLLQLTAAADSSRSEKVYDTFKKSFSHLTPSPNSYHYAMIRSRSDHIWTTNYDRLFESAIYQRGFSHQVVYDDKGLLDNFQSNHLIIKMNGDFQNSKYSPDFNWGLVFLESQFDLAERDRREIWRLFEDDFRNSCIVFVGTSFTDPALRRLLSNMAEAVPRTRFWHHLLVKAARHPFDRALEAMYCESLKRLHIETHLFNDFDDIERFVQKIALIANRPIVGFSGTGKQDKQRSVLLPNERLENGTI